MIMNNFMIEEKAMHIIIIGCGKLGSTLAKELSIAGHDISIIDHDNERLNVLGSGFNGLKIKGIEYDNDHLIEAGIKNADFVLAVTPDDNLNITAVSYTHLTLPTNREV